MSDGEVCFCDNGSVSATFLAFLIFGHGAEQKQLLVICFCCIILLSVSFSNVISIFTARCYASAVLAMGLLTSLDYDTIRDAILTCARKPT